MSVSLGTLAITSGTKTTFTVPSTGAKAIVIGNESGLTCTVTMEGGNVQKTLYPGLADWFPIKTGFNGNILINPQSILNNVSSWPASSLVFDIIGTDDPEDVSQYPITLIRNTNVGNTVATTGGSTTSVTNDNQTSGTQFIEATPTGASGSTVSVSNDGSTTIKSNNNGVLTTLLQIIAGSNPALKLGAASVNAEVLGTLITDGGLNTNTIRDNSTGTTQATLATSGVTFNNILTLSNMLSVGGKATIVNGATSGQATIYEIFTGGFRAVIIIFSNFANNSGADQDTALTFAFSTGQAVIFASDIPNFDVKNSTTKQNIFVLTTLASGGGTTTSTQTMHANSIGFVINAFDHLSFLGLAGATGHNGMLLILGQ